MAVHVTSLAVLKPNRGLVTALYNFKGRFRLPIEYGGGDYLLVLRADSEVIRRRIKVKTSHTRQIDFILSE